MTHSLDDDPLREDLRALAEESARDVPDFAETAATLSSAAGPYRDDRPGAEARRRALFEERLRELAFLPTALERAFVHRVSRAAAGAVALLGGALLALAILDPWVGQLAYLLFGVPSPTLAGALFGFAVLGAYVIAGGVAERYYEHRLRRSVSAGGELYRDVERLAASRPTEEARRLAARVDGPAVALPLLGAAVAGPLFGFLAFFFHPHASFLDLVARNLGHAAAAGAVGAVFAIGLGLACDRESRREGRSLLVRASEHWATALGAVVIGVFTLWYGARSWLGFHRLGVAPGAGERLALSVAGVVALLLPVAWGLLWLRRRENRRMDV